MIETALWCVVAVQLTIIAMKLAEFVTAWYRYLPLGLDDEAVASALLRLGLTQPVSIVIEVIDPREVDGSHHDPNMMVGGYYVHDDELDIHMIVLDARLTEDDASNTLWHELTHALQCERDFRGCGSEFHTESHRQDYANGPIEVEARSMAEYWAPKLPLVHYTP